MKTDLNAITKSVGATASARPLKANARPGTPGVLESLSKPNLPSKLSADYTSSPHTTTSDLEAAPRKEPKKGSYAEIMARAKANQAKPQAVGTINHKPKEKGALSYKKELKLQKQAKRDQKMGFIKGKGASRPSSADEAPRVGQMRRNGAKPEQVLPAKKPKPQPVYKGTMNPASVTARAKEKAAAQTARRDNEYAGTDDELDEDEDLESGDGVGYDDDEEESDDMEAGFSDVELEETAADRAARREDEEEARLEARLKREKEERKRRVQELAKRAKPQRY